MKVRNLIISVVLIAAAVVLAVVLYNSIMHPVKFDQEYNKRSDAVIAKLKDIRTIQETYRSSKGEFCNDIDSLLLFLETGKVPMVQKYGEIPDGMNEAQALAAGVLKRDTTYVNPMKKLYEEGKMLTAKEEVKNLKYIPYADGNVTFKMAAKKINKGGIDVSVFLVEAPIDTYTFGMDRQDVINKKAELESKNKYAGWKVGDLEQVITDGNWE
ncbi:MAG TPA: hypothetical protein IAC47_01665 [Candidatus Onthomorpha intestinigallinarum]|uniref:Uncharacterized protein n=1 Tax=Candidatus Onthomorpha intestinigallinarum TaxID=2840880 RepID=A0A9D1UGH4_9BACT|nr:hypothetical protein [Candidatus Onthomorpha intestinigallinarum]